ncbi:MAG: outer membrane protein assembly factor BamE [Hyphomicrobiales bacterium]
MDERAREVPGSSSTHRDLFPTNRFQKILILIAAGLLVAFMLFVAYMRIGPHLEHYLSSVSFDGQVWKQAENTNDPVRIFMVDDLLATHDLIGMSRSEIDALLGTPPKTPFFSDYQYVYWLGLERSYIKIDSEWLFIKFDQDRVVETKLLND